MSVLLLTGWMTLVQWLNLTEPCFFIYEMEILVLTFHGCFKTQKNKQMSAI